MSSVIREVDYMLTLLTFNGLLLAGETLDSDRGPDFAGMLLRIGLFLLFLLVFVFACGYAWRTIPALKAILPPPQKRVTEPYTLNFKPLTEEEGAEVISSSSAEQTGTLLEEQSPDLAVNDADGSKLTTYTVHPGANQQN
jgi:hypothetical protein